MRERSSIKAYLNYTVRETNEKKRQCIRQLMKNPQICINYKKNEDVASWFTGTRSAFVKDRCSPGWQFVITPWYKMGHCSDFSIIPMFLLIMQTRLSPSLARCHILPLSAYKHCLHFFLKTKLLLSAIVYHYFHIQTLLSFPFQNQAVAVQMSSDTFTPALAGGPLPLLALAAWKLGNVLKYLLLLWVVFVSGYL